jgi:hypothetical protein
VCGDPTENFLSGSQNIDILAGWKLSRVVSPPSIEHPENSVVPQNVEHTRLAGRVLGSAGAFLVPCRLRLLELRHQPRRHMLDVGTDQAADVPQGCA